MLLSTLLNTLSERQLVNINIIDKPDEIIGIMTKKELFEEHPFLFFRYFLVQRIEISAYTKRFKTPLIILTIFVEEDEA